MKSLFTAAGARALELAGDVARRSGAMLRTPEHLLWALRLDESRAAQMLAAQGITQEELQKLCPLAEAFDPEAAPTDRSGAEPLPESDAFQLVLLEARRQAALLGRHVEIGSEHLLAAIAVVESPARQLLLAHQLHIDEVVDRAGAQTGFSAEPIAADVQLVLPGAKPSDAADTYRIVDAAANRAREGVRVLEDYVRFVLDDSHLTRLLKTWRHDFSQCLEQLDARGLLSARDTPQDVGTVIHTRHEAVRDTVLDVVRANFKRVQEAARTLEEYGKVLSSEFGARMGALRYEFYVIEKSVLTTQSSRERLDGRNLYLLVTEDLCRRGSGPVIRAALDAGAGIIQVREKTMSDRNLVAHGKRVREWTRDAGALYIMNDRPDLALLTDADGVHVGQEELTVREVRRIIGPTKLVGVSTHSIEQARQAVLDGADYIGVGPIFTSTTKSFSKLAGLDFLRQVAAEITLPAFPIGGINLQNLAQVLDAGANRVAVSGVICGAESPGDVASELHGRLARVHRSV